MDLNEFQTRKQKIDVLLKEQGWIVGDGRKVIIERFRKRVEENPEDRKGKCFLVPFDEIKENGYDLSISRYKEIEYEEIDYDPPEVIIEKIGSVEDQIKANIGELKEMLERG